MNINKKSLHRWNYMWFIAYYMMCLIVSCVPTTKKSITAEEYLASLKIGHFDNLYEGDDSLAGLEVHQLPVVDNAMKDYYVYVGKHPGTIDYHFWDGRICSVRYSPEGEILHREWSHHSPSMDAAGYTSWEYVDFSKGSDPNFKRHKDPRNESTGSATGAVPNNRH